MEHSWLSLILLRAACMDPSSSTPQGQLCRDTAGSCSLNLSVCVHVIFVCERGARVASLLQQYMVARSCDGDGGISAHLRWRFAFALDMKPWAACWPCIKSRSATLHRSSAATTE